MPPPPTPPAHGPDPVLTITALASDGDGIARTADGRVVFVEGAVPGDRVVLGDVTRRRKVLRGRIARLVEASPDRVEPSCRHFGACGGCIWQHVRYATQLEAKQRNLRGALERIGGLRLEGEVGIVASPDPLRYRARARVVEAEGGVGYRRRGSHEAMRVESCPVLVPAAQAALAALGRVVAVEQAGAAKAARGAVRERGWTITAGSTGPARVFPNALPAREGTLELPREGSRPIPHSDSPASAQEVTLEVLGEQLRVGGPGFVQGNALLWARFAEAVRDRCLAGMDTESGGSARSPRRFVELYAGIGFLTLPIARAGLVGVAVESDRQAAADLAFNLERAGLAMSVRAIAARVESERALAGWLVDADVLLVDPPRIGLEQRVCEAIAKHGPKAVVYVSCDPATLARDLARLTASGYRLTSIVAFDLFPQTPHVEAIVRLER
ncbi:MAG: class I SAM-dependent RNA methyltransferase [Deltaproteobacteria bacterium]|nr:class I SAM-dependent RNA methyltransferase [Deltaproteobacteria bacterium]